MLLSLSTRSNEPCEAVAGDTVAFVGTADDEKESGHSDGEDVASTLSSLVAVCKKSKTLWSGWDDWWAGAKTKAEEEVEAKAELFLSLLLRQSRAGSRFNPLLSMCLSLTSCGGCCCCWS